MDKTIDKEDVKKQLESLKNQVASIQDVMKQKQERVIIFVDNTNLTLSSRKIDPCYRIDYSALTKTLTGNRFLRQCRIYYSDFVNGSLSGEEQNRRSERETFYDWLRHQGYWLKGCNLVERDGVTKEKGLDTAITKDIQRLCQLNVCDTVILISGDADYCETVDEIRSIYAIRVEVAFFEEFTAKKLKKSASEFVDLSRMRDTLRRSN
jgi:uncharacterized LabA/DUF88 family protein